MSDDDSRGYINLGPSSSKSQISTTDTIYDGQFGSPVNMKTLVKEFGLSGSKNHEVCPSPSAEPRLSSTTIGSRSDNAFSLGDARDIYLSIEPEYAIKAYKFDSESSMDSTQTESDIFPLGEGYYPDDSFEQSFEAASFRSSTSLSSISSATAFPKAKLDFSSDQSHTFSSASQSSDDLLSSDCCLTPEIDIVIEDEYNSDISCTSQVFENALHALPPKFIITSDKCVVFYLENHCSNEIFVALDAPPGIDCTPTDMTIGGFKKKKIVVVMVARNTMLLRTGNKIRVTYKLNNDSYRLNVPFSVASQSSDDLSSSDCCLTAESEIELEDGYKSDISGTSEVFENALHALPRNLEIENDKCVVFYLENHCSNELCVALDAPPGIDCSPTDMTIDGYKKKKIVVVARKSMLIGTRNKIRVTYKFNNDSNHFKVPFSIV